MHHFPKSNLLSEVMTQAKEDDKKKKNHWAGSILHMFALLFVPSEASGSFPSQADTLGWESALEIKPDLEMKHHQ